MSYLYTVIIYPLELLFEVLFTIAYRIVGSPALAIVILSLAVNFLVLPLYNKADAVQKKERDLEESLESGINKIKKAFKGDERMMMLQAYYRENNYSPLFVLKGSISLLLQIPFFIAAYHFLSNLASLQGVSFGPIKDLGAPDQIFMIGALSVNVLPITMTLINIISGYIYTKGMPVKSKVQLYGMALLFLVLLYNSPSGLVLYWTLNNVFSLVKNVIYSNKSAVTNLNQNEKKALSDTEAGEEKTVFFLSGLLLSVLIGLLIPSTVIRSSPTEFMNIMDLKSPNAFVIHSGLIALGFFILWGGIFFFLANHKTRIAMSRLWLIMCPSALVTYFFFGTNLGLLTKTLAFSVPFEYSMTVILINIAVIVIVSCLIMFLYHRFAKLTEGVVLVVAIVCVILSALNINAVRKSYLETKERILMEQPSFSLSTTGRNVMVIMLDRAPGYLVPFIFDEIPELRDQFDGFTFYPNALSFGARTKHAAPALFGGYEYVPQLIVADEDKNMVETQNEALSVMPLIFRDEGYEVTICDPPYAGYMSPPDLRVFSGPEYEGIESYITIGNLGGDLWGFAGMQEDLLNRNFFCYSILKVSPLFLHDIIYDNGNYNMADTDLYDSDEFTIPQIVTDKSNAIGVNQDFMDNYQVISNLAAITDIVDKDINTFMYIDNELTHSPMLLSEPDYEPAQYIDNTSYDINNEDRFDSNVGVFNMYMSGAMQMSHYEINASAYIMLGKYFDYLRECGVWDNTRIIIVADHAICPADVCMFDLDTQIPDTPEGSSGVDAFNPVLMVKDFGSTGFTTCDDIITNADVPYIACEGIISDPVNPFTGNPIISLEEYDGAICVYDSYDLEFDERYLRGEASRFIAGNWYSFDGSSVFDLDSWTYAGFG